MKNEEGKLLGKRVEYPRTYCPEILVAVPRVLNREIYGIDIPEELFCGYDSWHAYEAGFILDNGMPVIGLLKIVYPSTSFSIVESKSLKLYLASYNMTAMGDRQDIAIQNYTDRIQADLTKLLSAQVAVSFYNNFPASCPFDFKDYEVLEDQILPETIRFSIYQEHPAYLTENSSTGKEELKVCSHLLKSNCKITGQPDWGSIYIHFKGNRQPDKASLLKYIVSLRNENHFHEEICEMTFKRLTDLYQPDILMVCCLYTRRGGIDICPARANKANFLPDHLGNSQILTQRSFRQ